jgi:hypothetical protein
MPLDPAIDVRLRIARGVNERLFALAEVERLAISDEMRSHARAAPTGPVRSDESSYITGAALPVDGGGVAD